MTDRAALVQRVESRLRAGQPIEADVCDGFERLAPAERAAFAPATAFLGCASACVGPDAAPTSTEDRVHAARLMLLALAAQTADPRWSSRILEQLLDAVMTVHDSEITDLLHALFDLSAEDDGALTTTRAHLIRDVVVLAFTRFRASYDAGDFSWATDRDSSRLEPAQAYLLLLALPEADVRRLRTPISDALAATPFADEARANLAEDGSDPARPA